MIIKVELKDKALCNGCPALREQDGYCKAYSFIVAEHGASYTLQVKEEDVGKIQRFVRLNECLEQGGL